MRRLVLPALVAAAALGGACARAPRALELPPGDGQPFPQYAEAFQQAASACGSIRTLTAELAISGKAGRQKLRGRVLAGFERPASLRLEGVAPFGPPAFILVADPARATLLLPRDQRLLTGVPPEAILEALVGISLKPGDLLAILAGCAQADPRPQAGRLFPGGWARIDLEGGTAVYLQQHGADAWTIRAGVRPPLRVEYPPNVSGVPGQVRLSVDRGAGGNGTELAVSLSQVETNIAMPAAAFQVKVPADAAPITLDQLRASGPLGERPGKS